MVLCDSPADGMQHVVGFRVLGFRVWGSVLHASVNAV